MDVKFTQICLVIYIEYLLQIPWSEITLPSASICMNLACVYCSV